MKIFNIQLSFLRVLYLILYVILAAVVFIIPILIQDNVYLTKQLIVDEEIVEGTLLIILFLLSILLSVLYKQELTRQHNIIKLKEAEHKTTLEKLDESFRYIGKINIQIKEIVSLLNTSYSYLDTENNFKKVLMLFCDRVLNVVNVDWVLFRIIDIDSKKTITERFQTREGVSRQFPQLNNKIIVENQISPEITSIVSNKSNLNIVISCNLPIVQLQSDQRKIIEAFVNQLSMLFIIFNSSYYKYG